jgi:hypothetical protein
MNNEYYKTQFVCVHVHVEVTSDCDGQRYEGGGREVMYMGHRYAVADKNRKNSDERLGQEGRA